MLPAAYCHWRVGIPYCSVDFSLQSICTGPPVLRPVVFRIPARPHPITRELPRKVHSEGSFGSITFGCRRCSSGIVVDLCYPEEFVVATRSCFPTLSAVAARRLR